MSKQNTSLVHILSLPGDLSPQVLLIFFTLLCSNELLKLQMCKDTNPLH